MPWGSTSPFPEVDAFISSVVASGGGRIRKVTPRPSLGAVEYEISGDRRCGNVGRRHRSNNVKYVALLARGVFFQACHDPDCAGYRSEERPLPMDCQTWRQLFEEEDFFQTEFDDDNDDDDKVLWLAAQQAEETWTK